MNDEPWPIANHMHDEITLAACPKCGGEGEYDARADLVSCQAEGCDFSARGPTPADVKPERKPVQPDILKEREEALTALCWARIEKIGNGTDETSILARSAELLKLETRLAVEYWKHNVGQMSPELFAGSVMLSAKDQISLSLTALSRLLTPEQLKEWLWYELRGMMTDFIRTGLLPDANVKPAVLGSNGQPLKPQARMKRNRRHH